MEKKETKKEVIKEEVVKENEPKHDSASHNFPPRLIGLIAEEVAKTVVTRLPGLLPKQKRKKSKSKANKQVEKAIFLDTSAIIDGRIFDVINTGIFSNNFVITESILLELKHLADSQDTVKRERGRKGLEYLEKLKKAKKVKIIILSENLDINKVGKVTNVDERLIKNAKQHKGKIITCDYNLEKKATIDNVVAINMNGLANALKVTAVPGESLHIKVLHQGKESTQGVGYLDDGTMIVIEEAKENIGKSIDVVVSRIIQTATGRILFAKKI